MINSTKIILIACILSAFGMYLTSCNKSDISEEILETAYDTNYVAIAKALNTVINDVEARAFIKLEAMKQFDGDYNFLIHDVLEHRFDDGSTFADKLSTGFDNKEDFINYIKTNRRLQIAIPIHCEEWNSTTYIPAVTFIDNSYDEQTTKYVASYNQDGQLIALDAQNEPDVPVVVLSLNESTDDSGRLVHFVTEESNNTALDLRVRYDGGNERVTEIQISNLGTYEGWLKGKPEIRLVVRSAGDDFDDDLARPFWKPKRKDAKNGFSTNVSIAGWDRAFYGNALLYTWVEEDGGSPTTIPITASYTTISNGTTQTYSVNTAIPVGNNDKEMAYRAISFTEAEPYDYDMGDFRWEGDMQ